jgi:hypothetical protein
MRSDDTGSRKNKKGAMLPRPSSGTPRDERRFASAPSRQ